MILWQEFGLPACLLACSLWNPCESQSHDILKTTLQSYTQVLTCYRLIL